MNNRQLVLEDGTVFIGKAFGSEEKKTGEIIFHTGMTGYQEVISDPTYAGKIAVMTFPSIGTYGINRDDMEAITPFLHGIVVKEVCHEPSNFRREETLDDFLKKSGIPGISGIDTRMLTRLLRKKGTMRAMMTNMTEAPHHVLEELKTDNMTLPVQATSITKAYIVPGRGLRIVVVDLGMKQSILHELTRLQCHITVVPYNYSVEDILRFKPDGVLISNGPGNPEEITETINTIKHLLGKIPLFGIGLGHQLFALACGGKTKKMHVGNYGNNFPVKDVQTDKTWITTKSCQYCVEETSVQNTDLHISFRSLNDGTIEGLQHNKYPAFTVQFHPEGAPGSNETNYVFRTFLQMIEEKRDKNGVNHHAKK